MSKTIQQFTAELREKQRAFVNDNRPLFIASTDTLAKMSTRIFEKGQNVNGQTHQYKQGGGIYMSYKKSRLLKGTPPRGKPGAERNVENRKTVYFEDYKSYRGSVGLDTAKVTFENQGDLRSDFENSNAGAGNPKPRRINKNHYKVAITRDKNVDKSRGLEARYGRIFAITREEKRNFTRIMELEFGRNV